METPGRGPVAWAANGAVPADPALPERGRSAPAARAAAAPWLRGAAFDLGLLALPWLPLWAWLVAAGGGLDAPRGSALAVGFSAVFALEFTHRQYTYYVAYGDRRTFRAHARGFAIAPLAVVAIALAFLAFAPRRLEVAAITALALWNVWHVVMQRFGLLRMYSAKAGGGLGSTATRGRDQRLIWTLVLAETALSFVLHRDAMADSAHGVRLMRVLGPVLGTAPEWIAAFGGAAALVVGAHWLRAEAAIPLPARELLPRWLFLGSTIGLLAVFVVSGPLVGFLCFTFAHAVEYLAFIHLFEKRRFDAPDPPGGFAGPVLRRVAWLGPALVALHVAAYWLWIDPYRSLEIVWVYVAVTNVLHFLYDGWIWKVRKAAVRAPVVGAG